jgi:hypothetical protein
MSTSVRRLTAFAALGIALVVPSAARSAAPPGATARCNDGTYSFSQTHSGTCSHHAGVAAWLDGGTSPAAPSSAATTGSTKPALGVATKSSNCRVRGSLPDPACSPGAVFASATKGRTCTPGYSSAVRDVPESEKRAVYREYGITAHHRGQYEVDHLVALELGGSNAISNLWPEPANPRPGFHEKDRLENYLHAKVCSGAMPLSQAQQALAHNWLSAYRLIA